MDARLRDGIGLFNEGRFFESHEILEEFYYATEEANKPFIEGLIQLAAAFRLYSDFAEVKGPVRMIHQALIRFENYPASYLDIRVNELSESMEAWANQASAAAGKRLSSIPKIHLQGFSFFT
jgi:predicted metal-dependent hydrolase